MIERISSGVPGLDPLIENGLPKGYTILVSGMPGTGKSIFCSQIVVNAAKEGKKALYLDLEQKPGKLEIQMAQFGWNTDELKKNLKVVSIDSSNSSIVDYALSEIKKLKYDIIILDSLDSISSNPMSENEINRFNIEQISSTLIPTPFDPVTIGRIKLKTIFNAIAESGATAIVTSEKVENMPGITRDTISEFLADGIIILRMIEGEEESRTLTIPKMRATKQKKGIYSFEITPQGIIVRNA